MNLIRKLVEYLEERCHRLGAEYHICGTDEDKANIYMVRYFVFRSYFFSIYIHRFLRSDVDDHHDHPFNFVSYIVDGGYTEETLTPVDEYGSGELMVKKFELAVSRREAGSIAYRPAEAIHRVIVDQTMSYEDRHLAPLTVVFLGPRFRTWGFWKQCWQGFPDCREFVKWFTYLKVNPDSEKARKHQ